MNIRERLAGWIAPSNEPSTEKRFGFQDWVDVMTFGGNTYPLLNTTMQPTSEEELARTATQAYYSNGPVFALTLARLQVFSQVRFQWTGFEKGRPSNLFGTPSLSILEHPWPGGVTSDLLARMEVDNTLAGNSYTRRLRRGIGPAGFDAQGNRTGKEDRLVRLRPDWVTIVMGSQEEAEHPSEAADVELVGYIYHPGGKRQTDRKPILLTPEEVAHYAPIPDPNHHFLGMSWVTPVMGDVGSDDAATIHKRKFFLNAATPNLAVIFDAAMDIDDVRQFKELFEEEHRGVANAYKTLFLGGGADAKTVGKDFKELDFAVTQGKGESRLASAAGVPPSWVGFSEGLQGSALNAGNFGTARRRMSDGTMAHLWTNAAASLESIVDKIDKDHKPLAGEVNLWYDTHGIPFLREDAKDAAEIQKAEAAVIAELIREGFEPESVKAAVQAYDWDLLQHTGMVSVQLQLPGANNNQPKELPAAPAAPATEGEPA
jgi:hypothetical protein